MYSDVPSSCPVSYFRLRTVRFGLQRQRVTYFTSNMWVTPFSPYMYSVLTTLARGTLRFPPLCRFSEMICKIQYYINIACLVLSDFVPLYIDNRNNSV